MDISDREKAFEKNEKVTKSLNEGWKTMFSDKKKLIVEGKDAFAAGKELMKKQKIGSLKEEDTEEIKKDEVISSEVPPVEGGEVPPVEGGEVPPVEGGEVPPVEGGEVPPVEGEPSGLQPNPEKQVQTQQFVQAVLKGVQSGDAENSTLVNEYGIFKADINDPSAGQFVVIAYPVDMKLKDIANVIEPVETPAEMNSEVPPVEGDDVPPVEGSEVPPVEGGEVPPVETDKETDETSDAVMESKRDPINIGKKDWKSYLSKIYNEKLDLKNKIQESEDKALEQMEKELKDAEAKGDKEEVAELKKEIAKHKDKKVSEKGKANAKAVAEKGAEKDKDDVQKLMKKTDKDD